MHQFVIFIYNFIFPFSFLFYVKDFFLRALLISMIHNFLFKLFENKNRDFLKKIDKITVV